MQVTKTATFGPVPVATEPLAAFYLAALTEIQEQYHKLPYAAELDLKLNPVSEDTGTANTGSTLMLLLTATGRTTVEERKIGFATMMHAMSIQPQFTGMNMEVKLVFKIATED
ncbi:uncharacterized protein BO97DRAFT_403829 [Aspergillus homomorphus CBS 101889]|uniref:Uncharacterized protein n=1 Tax=Aspergillus homomorphus (strain CBS 101889) TaxID=1450537 RepID=A0A395I3G8_ASPHC|nr:hypothetical protein BO97DRAFT_403829 [Aspergillus homomorphus CBS 101889]RAL14741.1 hypothetical protein BO97DRAFT_403829 [Aspergillus homomorphus CBS 101889]